MIAEIRESKIEDLLLPLTHKGEKNMDTYASLNLLRLGYTIEEAKNVRLY